jgi:nucleoside-diphosphate-sugar epimerase
MDDVVLSKPLPGKAILTGASGFIGSRLRDALLAAGTDVISLVRASSPPTSRGRSAAVDYADEASLREVFLRERPDYVFHLAGATKGVSAQDFYRGNVLPTKSLVRALKAAHPGLARFVFVSSLTAYGPSNEGPPLSERDAPRPVELYGKSKLEAEQVLEKEGGPIAWTILRPAGVYGPADVDSFVLFRSAQSGINLFYGNRAKRASMVYVDDLVDALVVAAQSERTRGKGYFICDGVSYTWQDIQGHIATAVGRRTFDLNLPAWTVQIASRAGELATAIDKKPRLLNRQKALMDAQRAWLCTHERAHADFGYVPRVEMADGTRRAYAWYRAEGWL